MPKHADEPTKRMIVVVGMHRSGTSASTRALEALGVELGTGLLAPGADNPRGYFEDERLLDISAEVLSALGAEWDSPVIFRPEVFDSPSMRALESEAVQIVRQRFGEHATCGFKNPRTARLWPFWQRVFERSGHSPSFLVVFRNPLSIARSLQHRNGLSAERSHLLSLLHMTEAMIHSRGRPRVALDYDDLINAPREAMARVARVLALPAPSEDEAAWRDLTRDFLSSTLRNSQYDPADLEADPAVSRLAVSAFATLRRWASEDPTLSDAQLQRAFGQIHRRLRDFGPVLADLNETEKALRAERERLSESEVVRRHLETEREEVQQSLDAGAVELESQRQRADRFEFEATQRTEQVEENRRVAGLLGAQLETARQEIERGHARLAEAQDQIDQARRAARVVEQVQTALAQANEELATLKVTQAEEIERHQEELTSQAQRGAQRHATEMADALARAAESHDEAIRSWERRFERVDARVASLETERVADRVTANELRGQADVLSTQIESLKDARDDHAARMHEWVRVGAVQSAGQVVELVRAIERTRQWRMTRALQKAVSKGRRRPWTDGWAQLLQVALALQAEARRETVEVRQLAARTKELRDTFQAFSAGELFRLSRASAALLYALRLKRRPDGPFETVRNRVGEISFLLEHLVHLPASSLRETDVEMRGALPAHSSSPSTVDVIVPVYGARAQTVRCLESVFASRNRTPHEIIVIDDASGDDALSRRLETWADEGLMTLLVNEKNLGFPATVNRGIGLHPDRDVLLLNSDTLVHGNWIDRLRRSTMRDWKVATATPFSNNAEICSYPRICASSPMPTASELAVLDARAARVNRSKSATIPTAVGFCMFIKREALRAVGGFDAERFGRGYGEENDFCLRARAEGFRHVLAADVFVAHEGGVSFSDAKAALIEAGLAEIDRSFPGYRHEIQSFIAEDPLRLLRQRIDLDEIGPAGPPGILMVSHSLGGGTHRHVSDLAARLDREGVQVFLLQPSDPGVLRLSRMKPPLGQTSPGPGDLDPLLGANLEFRLPQDFDALVEVLDQANVRHLHLQHSLGVDASVFELGTALGCEFDATLHDYLAICPRVHLIDDRGRYCGLPEVDACQSCVKRNGSEVGFEVDVRAWRSEAAAGLARARRVFVPSEDTRARLAPYLPEVDLVVRSHPEKEGAAQRIIRSRRRRGKRRIAVIGAIGPHKGSEFLLACALDAAERQLPVEFHLIGYSDRDEALLATGKVKITGRYEEAELPGLLHSSGAEIALIPSLWPETYCYVLSAAFRAQIFPMAFDLGAIRDRIEDLGWGDLMPLETEPSAANDRFISIDPPPFPSDGASATGILTKLRPVGVDYESYLDDYYDGLKLS